MELFSIDTLPCRQSDKGVAVLVVVGLDKEDSTSCLLVVYII